MRFAIISGLLITFISLLVFQEGHTHVSGANAALSGGAGENNCTQCHSGTVNSGTGTPGISTTAPGGVYTPGMTYTITVSIEQSSINRWGFEVLVAHTPVGNKTMGTVVLTSTTTTQQKASGSKKYVTHRLASSTGSGSKTWSFDWTAPTAPGAGDLTFYVAYNAANNNGSTSGDKIYTRSLTLTEGPVATDPGAPQISVNVFPSFAENEVTLAVENPGIRPFDVHLLDMQGHILRSERHQPIGTEFSAQMDLSGIAPGVYFVKVTGSDFAEVKKVVKL